MGIKREEFERAAIFKHGTWNLSFKYSSSKKECHYFLIFSLLGDWKNDSSLRQATHIAVLASMLVNICTMLARPASAARRLRDINHIHISNCPMWFQWRSWKDDEKNKKSFKLNFKSRSRRYLQLDNSFSRCILQKWQPNHCSNECKGRIKPAHH